LYEYQKNQKYFAQVPGLMEPLCEAEFKELGAVETEITYRGVFFTTGIQALYNINYNSRLCSRVLAPLVSFPCHTTEMLTKKARSIKWEDFLTVDQTFSITCTVSKSRINNSLYAAQCLKDGISDHFRDIFSRRPSVDTVSPDVRFNLHIEKDKALISLDTSGESLHKRGYRLKAGEAPMQETLAAALVRISGWDGEIPFWDPMCGSGTIIAEALMHYCRIPAQYLRKNFGFFNMPDFDKAIWESIKKDSDSRIRPLPNDMLLGSDKSQIAIRTAEENIAPLPFADSISLKCHPFEHTANFENGVIVTNPPYGIRLGEKDAVQKLYKELGDYLKNNCKGTTAFVYTGDRELAKHIGLRPSKRVALVNGKLEGVLLRIDSYAGSRKNKYNKQESEQ